MRDYFFQIVLFLAGAFIGLAAQSLPSDKHRKWLARLLGGLCIAISLIWIGYEIENTAPNIVDNDPPSTPCEEKESTLAQIKCSGVVRVGYANEQPYAFLKPDGTLSGESIEVARVIFNRLGISTIEGVVTKFELLIPALQAGNFDIITAGMWILPDRCEQVLFADPEFTSIVDGNPNLLFGAAAFRKEDTELRDAFNVELQKLRDSGELEGIINQFEGYNGKTFVADSVTAAEICNP